MRWWIRSALLGALLGVAALAFLVFPPTAELVGLNPSIDGTMGAFAVVNAVGQPWTALVSSLDSGDASAARIMNLLSALGCLANIAGVAVVVHAITRRLAANRTRR